jgi:hypothetical protein
MERQMGIDDDNGAATPAGPGDYPAAENTDTHLWPIVSRYDDPFPDSIHVTAQGAIGINCGGLVIVKPLREWHALAAKVIAENLGN